MRAITTGLIIGLLSWSSISSAEFKGWGDPRTLNDKDASGWTFGISHGSTGFGIEASHAFTDVLSIRGSIRGGNVSFETTSDQIKYKGDIKLGGGFLFADITPFSWKGIVLSVGATANKFKFESEASCRNPAGCKIGNQTFSPAQLGTLSADMKANKFAPYLGFGIGTPFIRKHPGFAIRGELGLMFPGTPDADISSNSAACNNDPNCVAALRKEEDDIEDDAKWFAIFPVFNLIVGYSF